MRARFAYSTAMVAIASGLSGQAVAQATPNAGATVDPQTQTPPDSAQKADKKDADKAIVVTGIRGSLRDALVVKRQAVGVVEVISAKDIGVLPNVTIAETLARLPGLNTVRDRGNESQAAIRGTGPRMVLGLLNGRELASPEPDRNIRWEIFPSEIVSGVTVYKSSQANLVSGGVSGTIDVQTLRPLDYTGPTLTVRAGPSYYEGGEGLPFQKHVGFRGSAAAVFKITPQLGFYVAGSYQRQQNGYESVLGGGWNDPNLPGTDAGPVSPAPGSPVVATPWGASIEEKQLVTDRYSVASSLQWRPSDALEVRLDGLYSGSAYNEHDDGGWYTDWGNWGGYETGTVANPGFTNNVIQNGALVKTDMTFDSTFHPYVSRYVQAQTDAMIGLNAKWSLNDWTVVGDIAYSQAERHGRWQAVRMTDDAGPMSYDYSGTLPKVYADRDAYEAARTGLLFPDTGGGEVDPNRVRDRLGSATLDVERKLGGFLTAADFGVRYSHRIKQDAEPVAFARPLPLNPTTPISASFFQPWNYKYFTVPTMIYGDFDTLARAIYGQSGLDTLNYDYANTPFVSKVQERVLEAYVMPKYETFLGSTRVDGNFGVRVVHVNQSSFGPSTDQGTGVTTNITVTQSYTKVLPSVNARFDFGNGLYLKAGLSRALSRPPLNDLRVDRAFFITKEPFSGGGGNPYLKPYLSDQADLSLEWYFHKDGLIAVAPYIKRIHNYIGFDTETVTLPGIDQAVPFTAPFNQSKTGTLKGVEFTFQTPFFFIPALHNFGINSNMALTSSSIHEFSPKNNPLPMNGVAAFTGNLDLYYDDTKLNFLVGLRHHSPYTLIYTWNSAGVQRLRSETTLDYSMGYNFTKHVAARFQILNILNTPLRLYDNNNPSEIARNDVYGRTFMFDMTFKY